jgi:hypothetical protein
LCSQRQHSLCLQGISNDHIYTFVTLNSLSLRTTPGETSVSSEQSGRHVFLLGRKPAKSSGLRESRALQCERYIPACQRNRTSLATVEARYVGRKHQYCHRSESSYAVADICVLKTSQRGKTQVINCYSPRQVILLSCKQRMIEQSSQ